MAGRPIDPAIREARKREVDKAIALLSSLGKPATRKNIAQEIGMAVQNLYGSGYLSAYIRELEISGIVCSEESLRPQLSPTEVKHLQKENKRLKSENECLRTKHEHICEALAQKTQEVQDLSQQLLVLKGELFKQQQHNFAKSRI